MGISGTPEATGDAQLATRINALEKLSACRVYNSVSLSIPHSTFTPLTFDSERFDTDAMHSTATNTSRITINTAGVYVVTAHIRWASASATGNRIARLYLGGVTPIVSVGWPAVAAMNHEHLVTTVWNFAAGEYVEVHVHQTSGGALNVEASTASPEFSAARIPGV